MWTMLLLYQMIVHMAVLEYDRRVRHMNVSVRHPNIFGIVGPRRLQIGVCYRLAKTKSHTNFQPNRSSSSREIADFIMVLIKFQKFQLISDLSGISLPIWLKIGV